ncbi:hypothetical protein PS710_02558 [Pseudomonas fluorescens]|jgi:hypothetical protein|uniref:Uncharacterized protein n=1 Tax=Pseudomonas fluorescens TaxID=294 RepID=A0A5E7C563_PSEFL|nr:hypothetical protein PS710_02558 [Pseudomonas fluorescens]
MGCHHDFSAFEAKTLFSFQLDYACRVVPALQGIML